MTRVSRSVLGVSFLMIVGLRARFAELGVIGVMVCIGVIVRVGGLGVGG